MPMVTHLEHRLGIQVLGDNVSSNTFIGHPDSLYGQTNRRLEW